MQSTEPTVFNKKGQDQIRKSYLEKHTFRNILWILGFRCYFQFRCWQLFKPYKAAFFMEKVTGGMAMYLAYAYTKKCKKTYLYDSN